MNHLHELLEARARSEVCVFVHGDESQWDAADRHKLALERLARAAPEAICFFGGALVDAGQRMVDMPDLVRLPFESTWIEFTHGQECFGLLCTNVADGATDAASPPDIKVHTYLRDAEHVWVVGVPVLLQPKDGKLWLGMGGLQQDEERSYRAIAWACIGFLQALNCTNVERQLHTPDAKLQKARAKRGRRPLFSYSTLVLKRANGEGVPLGGTHASPAVHLRRGHPRQYAPGKYTWVQPCVVGNPARGIAHKDYDASALVA